MPIFSFQMCSPFEGIAYVAKQLFLLRGDASAVRSQVSQPRHHLVPFDSSCPLFDTGQQSIELRTLEFPRGFQIGGLLCPSIAEMLGLPTISTGGIDEPVITIACSFVIIMIRLFHGAANNATTRASASEVPQ